MRSYSWTGTVYLGYRLTRNTEVYLNPEVAAGLPLSELGGLGGFPNGELARTSGRSPTLYRARAFVRHTVGLGGGTETVDPDDNQIARSVDRNRFVITAGNLSALDVFDDNRYAKDARTQFSNWALIAPGGWDFAADARGYTWGFAGEYITPSWAVRAGRFAMPQESNGLRLNRHIFQSYGDVIEGERQFSLGNHSGVIRLLAYRSRATMASFRDALAFGEATRATPEIANVRTDRAKYGVALNGEFEFTPDFGAFSRISWSDGQSETFAFTEIDRSQTGGVSLRGSSWQRRNDTLGVALIRNELSRAHRDYLAAGGIGFFIGDGALRYAPEQIAEVYYSAALTKKAWLTLNAQHIRNPAYNADRGPAYVYGIRLHLKLY